MKKKHKILIASIIGAVVITTSLLFFIFSNKGVVTENEVSRISDYPSTSELKEKLGTPTAVVDNKNDVLNEFNSISTGNYSTDIDDYDSAKTELENSDSIKLIKYKDRSTRDYFEYYFSDDTFVYSVYNLK
jgi:hypothetical protein